MLYAAVLAVVVLTLVSVTVWKMRSVRNRADFLVAGRKLTWPVLVFTLLSSWIGATPKPPPAESSSASPA